MMDWYRGRRVLVTGHTGFKGSYLAEILLMAGADVTGFSLDPPTDPSLFELLHLREEIRDIRGDVRDYGTLCKAVSEARPEVVFHLAAQPIVRESYRIPRETFETNIMGTVNLLEALRKADCAESIVNVTTDKVYLNVEKDRGYLEEDPLDGYDPYSNSKSCSDLVTHSYWNSFFRDHGAAVSTARAGNVIGGGDFAPDRIVPDCVRAAVRGEPIVLRNPSSVRPFQHVFEPLAAYLLLAKRQTEDRTLAGAYNVGPGPSDAITAGEIADLFIEAWDGEVTKTVRPDGGPHEAKLLMLDSSKIRTKVGWKPVWDIREAVRRAAAWSKAYADGKDMRQFTRSEIGEYFHV